MGASGHRRRARRNEAGQSLVEIAIALPILILIVIALFEGGAFAFTLTTVEHAAQDGGRLAALPGTPDEDTVKAYIIDRAGPAPVALDASDITITVLDCSSDPCAEVTPFTARTTGHRVRVEVIYEYNPLTANVFGSGTTFGLTATTEYMVE